MRIVLRQQDTLINTINSMQQQNDNLYSLITDLLRQQEAAATAATTTTTTDTSRSTSPISRRPSSFRSSRRSSTRPRTHMFFNSPLSGINERITRTPRIVTHHRNGNVSVNIPGSVNQTTTTEDIIN